MTTSAPAHLQHQGLVSLAPIRQLLASTIEAESHWIKDLPDREFAAELTRIAHAKRFMQRWQADPDFRAQVSTDSAGAVARYNLQVDPEEIKLFWCPEQLEAVRAAGKLPILVQRCLDFIQASEQHVCADRIDTSHNRHYQAWRSRQIARLSGQLPQAIAQGVAHASVSFELSKGCSVGCWFCSVSAPTLNDVFSYTPEHARLWQDILQLLKNVLGTAAAAGFCYWATDPLDNPDYEQFLSDFHTILGVFPQTTTAQPLKDIARTKSLLKLALEKGNKLNRFSILSLKMFDRVSAAFTPEELAFVELVLQNQEAGIVKANAGRMRDRNEHQAARSNTAIDTSLPTTNACVSGFLFNLVDLNVKLISPCPASNLWPNGYRIYAEGTFNTVAELTAFIDRAIETHMPLTLRSSDRLQFRSDLTYEEFEDGFQVSTRFLTLKFRNEPYLKQLGRVILQGDKTLSQITSLFNVLGVTTPTTLAALNLMFEQGILDR
jgi:radical SAM family RiPP maturation amino acid epimerase